MNKSKMIDQKYYHKHFSLPVNPDNEEEERVRKQSNCPHDKYVILCSHCKKILGSELTGLPVLHDHPKEILI